MKKKKLMILGGSILQLPAIQKATALGLDVIVLDMDPDAVGFSVKGVKKEIISTIDIPAAVKAARKHNIDGVMTLATDMPMRTVSAIAKDLNLTGISEDAAIKATDKSVMRECLELAGVPVPHFYRIESKEDYLLRVNEFNKPFIVKPADSSGSRGIYLVRDISDFEDISTAYDYTVGFSKNKIVVIEEYMSGPEVSVEAITVNGQTEVIQITDKITTGPPHFVELGHTQPSRLNRQTTEKIKDIAKKAISAIGIIDGPSHTEIIVTEEGPKIVEIGARLGGDFITTHLTTISTGVDMVECCIKIALGEKADLKEKHRKGSAIRYFAQHKGTVEAITGLSDAEKTDGGLKIGIVHGVGEKITDIDCSGARMGFVIAEGRNAQEAQDNCENALSKIKVSIR